MVTAYEFAQILPTTRGRPGGGSLLVLGSANVGYVQCLPLLLDRVNKVRESLRGYLTKVCYRCLDEENIDN